MSKHTPGPWRAVQASNSGQVHILAEVNGYDRAISMDIWNDCDEQEANVRLIVAAPDLLEALEGVTDMAADMIPSMGFAGLALIEAARAAIAKARGEA